MKNAKENKGYRGCVEELNNKVKSLKRCYRLLKPTFLFQACSSISKIAKSFLDSHSISE